MHNNEEDPAISASINEGEITKKKARKKAKPFL